MTTASNQSPKGLPDDGEQVADALNTLCKMLHSGEEVEGDDGLAMLVPMDLWNEAQEAIELLVGEDEDTQHTAAVLLSDAKIGDAIVRHIVGHTATYNQLLAFARDIEASVINSAT